MRWIGVDSVEEKKKTMSMVNVPGERMTLAKLAFFISALVLVIVRAKTIRSKIYTDENGTRELIFDDYAGVSDEDVKSLLENLSLLNVTSHEFRSEPTSEGDNGEKKSENILMKHWNSLTEVGWKNYSQSVQKLYPESGVKSEKEDEESKDDDVMETQVKEVDSPTFDTGNATESSVEYDRKEPRIETDDTTAGKSVLNEPTSRTFLRPRRVLHKILLPLLVLLVIKYLVTLPFVAVSAFTLNSMWLGLLSLAAVLINKFKFQDRFYPKWPWKRWSNYHAPELYETQTITPTEIIWSPIRVPVTPATIDESSFG